jgi:hypothetical protein
LSQRHTLELRRVNQLQVQRNGNSWRCSFVTPPGIAVTDLPVTDLELLASLNAGRSFVARGFAVVSLGIPYAPPLLDWEPGAVGWKLLAAWIPSD